MKRLKVMTVIGTRPEIIRLACIIKKLEKSEAIEHVLVHTGQNYNYELNEVFFRDLNLNKPDYILDAAQRGASETIGNILIRISEILEKVKPDAFLILGDTNSCLSAIAAKKRQIPIFHMEAGNRCFDQRVPEEINRKIVDHISDINMTYSDISREYLIDEGLPADRIIKTGSPLYEVINSKINDINGSSILQELKLTEKEYFIVSAHREENIESNNNFKDFINTLNKIAQVYRKRVIVTTHPRTRNKIESSGVTFEPLIELLKPLGFNDYIKLQLESKAVLSDSGTISEEASILKFPALNIRQAHERPEAMEEGSVMMVGLEKTRVLQGLKILETQNEKTLRQVKDYFVPNVSDKILRIILSYTDYINRFVWKKN